MKRFWFDFGYDNKLPPGIILGCGVTAFSYEDALQILIKDVFKTTLPEIKKVIEEVDISTLDKDHVLPNMYPPNIRGVWFPIGFPVRFIERLSQT